jgi:hypothetical protein
MQVAANALILPILGGWSCAFLSTCCCLFRVSNQIGAGIFTEQGGCDVLCLALNLRRGRQQHIGLTLDDLLNTLG